jgi:hypothetical protein
MIKEHPINFNAEEVSAVLDGKKTQHIIAIKPQNLTKSCNFLVGNRLLVRETFCVVDDREFDGNGNVNESGKVWIDYRATPSDSHIAPAGWRQEDDPKDRWLKWSPAPHMRREHSRILVMKMQ